MKALLYANNRDTGNGGERRAPRLVKNTIDLSDDYDLVSHKATNRVEENFGPMFGPYLQTRRRVQAAKAAAEMFDTVNGAAGTASEIVSEPRKEVTGGDRGRVPATTVTTANTTNNVITPVERVVGRGLKNVGAYKSLDQRAQVVALINEVRSKKLYKK